MRRRGDDILSNYVNVEALGFRFTLLSAAADG